MEIDLIRLYQCEVSPHVHTMALTIAKIIPATAFISLLAQGVTAVYNCEKNPFKHVVQFSVDGMHGSDVGKWVALRPNSNFSRLLQHGYEYADAFTSAPSDSFPGTVAQYTGASPRTSGVWYDDTFDWTYYAPGSDCAGPPGAEGMLNTNILVLYLLTPHSLVR